MQEGTSASVGHTAVTAQVRPLSEWLSVMPVTEFGACPVRDVLDRIGDKWSMLVITLLGEGPMRFMELKRSIGLVSQRMLTRTLRSVELAYPLCFKARSRCWMVARFTSQSRSDPSAGNTYLSKLN